MNDKRAKLVEKRHFIHEGKLTFWEEFEQYLMTTYEYDPTKHHLVINGDGAKWITSCRDYFQHNATFVIDRFHVSQDVQRLFRDHSRYRSIRKKVAKYDWKGFMVEVNSAVGTLNNEKKEERLEELIAQLSQYPEALGDYREKLKAKGIDTTGFRPMGSAEGTMSVFARRLKNGRSWSDKGLDKFIDIMVALKDKLEIKTLHGILDQTQELTNKNKEEKAASTHCREAKEQRCRSNPEQLRLFKTGSWKTNNKCIKRIAGNLKKQNSTNR